MRLLRLAGQLVVAVAAACALQLHAAGPIYKCVGADGSKLYTDTPCNGGEAVDLHPGSANPAAVERLARDQQAASERYARERAAAREMEMMRPQETRIVEAAPQPAYSNDNYWCDWCGGWVAPLPPKPPIKPRPRRPAGVVPARPMNPAR